MFILLLALILSNLLQKIYIRSCNHSKIYQIDIISFEINNYKLIYLSYLTLLRLSRIKTSTCYMEKDSSDNNIYPV